MVYSMSVVLRGVLCHLGRMPNHEGSDQASTTQDA